jgi:hypothetical protein
MFLSLVTSLSEEVVGGRLSLGQLIRPCPAIVKLENRDELAIAVPASLIVIER